jgi:hypothetical protein
LEELQAVLGPSTSKIKIIPHMRAPALNRSLSVAIPPDRVVRRKIRMTAQILLSPKLTSLEKLEQPMNSNEVNRTAPKLVTYLAILGCLGTGLA